MDDRFKLIEKYLDGELDKAERTAFERDLKEDDSLAEDVQLVINLRASVHLHLQTQAKAGQLKKTTDQLAEKYFTSAGNESQGDLQTIKPIESSSRQRTSGLKISRNARVVLRIAASVALLVAAFLFIRNRIADTYEKQTLSQQFYIDIKKGERGRLTELSLEQISALPENDNRYLYGKYLSGGHFFEEGLYRQSKGAFDTVLAARNDSRYDTSDINFEAARWNRLLANLAVGEEQQVLQQLDEILGSESSAKYKELASKLKKKLNSPWYKLAN